MDIATRSMFFVRGVVVVVAGAVSVVVVVAVAVVVESWYPLVI